MIRYPEYHVSKIASARSTRQTTQKKNVLKTVEIRPIVLIYKD